MADSPIQLCLCPAEAAAEAGNQSPRHHQQQQQPQAQPPPPAAKGKPLGMGLKLTVGSTMETGEWKSGGLWLKKDKEKNEVPSNLQVIAPEDLVKVSCVLRGDKGVTSLRCTSVQIFLVHARPRNDVTVLLSVRSSGLTLCCVSAGQGAGAWVLWQRLAGKMARRGGGLEGAAQPG